MSPDRNRGNPWARLVVGLTLLTAGVIFWLDRIGSIDARQYLRWWPLALIALGLAHLARRRWAAAAAWLIAGTFFLLPVLGVTRVHIWQVIGMWPLLISVGGITLIVQAIRGAGMEPDFRAVAVMAGNVRKIASQQLSGGDAVAVMGGCEIDLSAAHLTGEAVIDVLAFWGGIEIRVPSGWKVVGQVAQILGGFEDKTAPAPDNAPRLVIRGAAIMGGVEVRNSAESRG